MNGISMSSAETAAEGREMTDRKPALTLKGLLSGALKVGAGDRPGPVVVRFEAEAEDVRPIVRLFVGTESAHHRAERVFLWTLSRVRDPGRRYEVTLLKDLAGVDRSGWATGYEGYRDLVPDFAGAGRALYCDVTRTWLDDPARLFDHEMSGSSRLESGDVALFDLEASGEVGELPSDEVAATSRDYGRRDAFPWQPHDGCVRYAEHPEAAAWREAEEAADRAAYTVFTKEAPSDRFVQLVELYRSAHDDPSHGKKKRKPFRGVSLAPHMDRIGEMIRETGAKSLLDYGSGKGGAYEPHPEHDAASRHKRLPSWGAVDVTLYDPGVPEFSGPYDDDYDAVIATDVLEHIPEEDIQWVLEEFFSHARKFVFAVATCFPAKKTLPNGENAHCTVRPPMWWRAQMEAASRRHPGVRWTLCSKVRSHLALYKRKGPLKKGVRKIHHSG